MAMLDSDASSAKALTLAAIILQLVFFLIGIFLVLTVAAFLVVSSPAPNGTTVTTTTVVGGASLILLIFSILFLVGLLWILLDYFLVYKKLADERVTEARDPALVLGIIQLIFGGLIPGILLIIAYIKISDSLGRNPRQPVQPYS